MIFEGRKFVWVSAHQLMSRFTGKKSMMLSKTLMVMAAVILELMVCGCAPPPTNWGFWEPARQPVDYDAELEAIGTKPSEPLPDPISLEDLE